MALYWHDLLICTITIRNDRQDRMILHSTVAISIAVFEMYKICYRCNFNQGEIVLKGQSALYRDIKFTGCN